MIGLAVVSVVIFFLGVIIVVIIFVIFYHAVVSFYRWLNSAPKREYRILPSQRYRIEKPWEKKARRNKVNNKRKQSAKDRRNRV